MAESHAGLEQNMPMCRSNKGYGRREVTLMGWVQKAVTKEVLYL